MLCGWTSVTAAEILTADWLPRERVTWIWRSSWKNWTLAFNAAPFNRLNRVIRAASTASCAPSERIRVCPRLCIDFTCNRAAPKHRIASGVNAALLCIAHWLDDAAHALIWCFLTWEQFPSGVEKTHETHGTHSSVHTVFCFNECIIQLQICDISEQLSGQRSFYSFIGNIFMIAFSFYIFIYCHFHSVSH